MRRIDIDTWDRAGPFRLFATYERPQYGLTARLDVTRLMHVLKPAGHRPFIVMLHAFCQAGNAVPAFRQRLRGGMNGEALSAVEHERIGVSPTVARPDGSFGFCAVPAADDYAAFATDAAERIARAAEDAGLDDPAEGDGWLYLSCTPAVDFTALTNAMRDRRDCVPRIVWGKFVENGVGRWSCAVSVEVHHSLVDGGHIAAFLAEAQKIIDTLDA
ncbi:CatA-like O-acetyltransferase [Notoacmeibacter sp. MSK16QG-6]|uniref:CatA-like O-acetyltransferase n=1 Tax=Notoacmeibacter sp. MSK16QG-6 TaxID=2957982 RepID=UPI00209D6593|nr:CatA-like O-acetyltransferase [Notoacmeibacter sp. MSK16QG-6]MCP1199265.1 CatA-like O-acetyltransferase [Notoacmeibacter sp. MSK16QG-6]